MSTSPMPITVILTTMVRNESKALPRLLRSAAQVCTAVALTDTGSTDNTVSVAETVCQELGLKLFVDHQPWEDFGRSRTKNLVHGRAVAAQLGDPKSCHLLLLDADMEIPAGTAAITELPEVGMLPQCDRQATWWNARTIRADLAASYIGRTHEYLSHNGSLTKLNWFTIQDHCDGGCRSDKFERDERLLRLDLAEKNDTRSRFYLAQSLKSLGRKKEAIQLYDERAKFEDFPEEAWMARLEASRLCEGPEADIRALEAYPTRPQRVEPLADVARRAADTGKHRYALWLSDLGKKVPYPDGESLYCGRHDYTWVFPYVDMISAYYVGDSARGAKACDFLRFTPGSPYHEMALDNAVFYMKQLPGTRRPLAFTPPPGFATGSPSIMKVPGGWLAMIRGVNYEITKEGGFPVIGYGYADAEHPITTRNFIVRYNDAWEPQGAPLELLSPAPPVPGSLIVGFEDQRIVRLDGDVLVTAGVRCDASPRGIPEIWEATWDLNTGRCLLDRKLSVHSEHCEKNWLPFEAGYLYGHHPGVTFTDADGHYTTLIPHDFNFSGFRGSAAPIPYRDGFLYVVHEVSGRGRRTYLTRFVFATRSAENPWKIEAVSRPFMMKGTSCMESCFAIQSSPEGIVLSCAYEDKEVYTITTTTDVVDALLAEGTRS